MADSLTCCTAGQRGLRRPSARDKVQEPFLEEPLHLPDAVERASRSLWGGRDCRERRNNIANSGNTAGRTSQPGPLSWLGNLDLTATSHSEEISR